MKCFRHGQPRNLPRPTTYATSFPSTMLAFGRYKLALTALLLSCILATTLLSVQHRGKCIMTYMWPSYFSLAELTSFGHPYDVYLYKEGRHGLSSAHAALAEASAPPVLFLHGSDGSYKQVRSLASETARQGTSGKPALAWFAADFKEEMSAFDGAILERQTRFTVKCVKWLRQHYQQAHGSDMPVVLVGHSMGGLIARAAALALAGEGHSGQSILAIITLAAPHQQAPANVHAPLHAFYSGLQKAAAVGSSFGGKAGDETSRATVPLLSIAGGAKDMLVLPELNALVGVWPEELTVEADVRDMPGVWVSADHQSMVWCNQLVVLLAKLLYTITQPDIMAQHSQPGAKSAIIQHMRAATQPHVATALGWAAFSNDASFPNSKSSMQSTAVRCQSKKIGADSIVKAGSTQQVIWGSGPGGCLSKGGCWWQWNQTDNSDHTSWTMLLHSAAPCSDFQLTHARPDMQQQVDVTHTAVALPDLRQQRDTDGEAAASQPHRQTWLVRLKDPGSISLWLGSADAAKQAVSGIVQVSSDSIAAPHLWQLMNAGYILQPRHAISTRVLLPYPAMLQALGMQLKVHSFRDSSDSPTTHPYKSKPHGSSKDGSKTSNTIGSNRDVLSQAHGTDSMHTQTAGRETDPGRKGGPRSARKPADEHQCWQPVLLAYGQSGREVMHSTSAREVIRTNLAELSLWAVEAAAKEIGVLSDPVCALHLRLEWEVRKAAANALRLHVAALPALAAALLLLRLALLILTHRPYDQIGNPDGHHYSSYGPVHSSPNANARPQILTFGCLATNTFSLHQLPRGQLLGVTVMWALIASWLWPQLALWLHWMSHRRPTLPSIAGCTFLTILTEGLLEALELIPRILTTLCSLAKGIVARQTGKLVPAQTHIPGTARCGPQAPRLTSVSNLGDQNHMRCRNTVAFVITAAITLAEARLHPMLALLHALLCHIWAAAQTLQPSKSSSLPASQLLLSMGDDKLPSQQQQRSWPHLPQSQHQHQRQGSQCEPGVTADGPSSGDDASNLATSAQQQVQAEAHSPCERQPQLLERDHAAPEGQMGGKERPSERQQPQEDHQAADHLPPEHFTPKASAQLGVRNQHRTQALHVKMLLCAVALQALPCVAWVKQLGHMRQLAAWQDVVPCAVMALHASALALAGLLGSPHHNAPPEGGLPGVYGMVSPALYAGMAAVNATYVAVAALHDQPFRALHGIAFVSALHIVGWMQDRLYTQHSCKRKPQ